MAERQVKIERPGEEPILLPPALPSSSVTAPKIYSLKSASKRKRPTNDDDDAIKREKRESSKSSGEPGEERFAPAKKNRQRRDKTLREQLGLDTTRSYKSSKEYTSRGSASTPALKLEDKKFLVYVIYLIDQCTKGSNVYEKRLTELREHLHAIEVEERFSNKDLIVASNILGASGFPRLVDPTVNSQVPWDIVSDAIVLLTRWKIGKYDNSLLRGIMIEKKAKGVRYKSDPEYHFQKVPSDVVGHNGLVNGQWWPIRQGVLRDGAHGEVEAGIAGKTGKGAFSIVMADGGYADKDECDTIYYCSTESSTNTPTKGTVLLRSTLSHHNHPIRVLRAAKKKSFYAPDEGIRYDGLYNIVSEELLKPETALYRFKLVRVPGQEPIRYKGPEKRPTQQQIVEKQRTWSTFANR